MRKLLSARMKDMIFRAMLRREGRKLDVAIKRRRGRRRHTHLSHRLMENRYDRLVMRGPAIRVVIRA